MKRSKFTSFLFTIAFGLFAFNFSVAQNSADCQDEVNISLGGKCDIAIPYEAFNTRMPSCLTITDATGMVVAALTGPPGTPFGPTKGTAGKFDCFITLDSITLDTINTKKVTTYKFEAWLIDCDPAVGPDTIAADLSGLPALTPSDSCIRDTFFTPDHFITTPGALTAGTVVIDIKDISDAQKKKLCPDNAGGIVTDGKLLFRYSVQTISIKPTVHKVMKVDIFSHLDPLRYVKGTAIVAKGNLNSTPPTDTSIHDLIAAVKATMVCDTPSFAAVFGTFKYGPAKLTPDTYTYNSLTPDSLNFCWGKIEVKFRLWPTIASEADTVGCEVFSNFSRAEIYDYHAYTRDKLDEVCEWAEAAKILRTDKDIAKLANASVVHCFKYTVTHVDKYIKNFDWLCDTVVKHREFYVARPGHTGDGPPTLKIVATDKLLITAISVSDVFFPDAVIAMDCGIVENTDPKMQAPNPEHIAEYLYHAFIDRGDIPVIVAPPTLVVGSGHVLDEPCDEFDDQYLAFMVTADTSGALAVGNANANIWTKVFKYADYNNYGVKKAFPYVERKVNLIDVGLKAKLDDLADAGDLTGVDANDYTLREVFIPVNKLLCNIAATYLDLHPVRICEGEYKYFRQWTLVDWCTGTVRDTTQIIKFFDRFAPQLDNTWEGVKAGTCSPDDDNSQGKEKYYFGDLAHGSVNHITKLPAGHGINTKDHLDCDGDGNLTENAPWVQASCTAGVSGDYIYTRYEKIANPWACTFTHKFPWLTFKKDCSPPTYYFELVALDGTSEGTQYSAGDEAMVEWTQDGGAKYPFVKIYIRDACENHCEWYYYLKSVDKIPPVVVLHDQIIVTLTANNEDFGSTDKDTVGSGGEDGIGNIRCTDVDAGSHDGACGAVTCKIRKKDSGVDWDDAEEFIHIDCDDLGDITVEVQITDLSGNTAVGWMTVTVENKNGPFITCEDVVVDCDDPIHPDWVGYPHVFDICASPGLEYSDEYNVDVLCFVGYINRTWSIPGSGVQCVQKITIDATDDGADNSVFNPQTIHWPLHYTSENWYEFITRIDGFGQTDVIIRDYNEHDQCEDFQFHYIPADARKSFLEGSYMNDQFYCELGDLNEPYWTDPVCGLVGKSYSDETFKFNKGICFTVIRRWVVIDWCVYDPNHASTDDPNQENDCYVLVKDLCAGKQYFKYDDGCIKVDGYYGWDQEIKIADNEQPVITPPDDMTVAVGAGSKTDDGACKGSVEVWATAVDFCGGNIVVGEDGTPHEGPELDWTVTLISVAEDGKQTVVGGGELYSDENDSASVHTTIYGYAGQHYILKWRVEDGCHNPAEAKSELWFVDVKAPVLFCIADLSTNAMSTDGTTEIWADNYGFANDCDGDDVPLYFKNSDGVLVPYLVLDCDDIPNGVATTWEGRVYAVDAAGNESYCEVTLRIVDSNDACEDTNSGASVSVSGFIADRFTQTIESAEVTLGGLSRMTPVEGTYAFEDMPVGNNYRLDAQKVDDYMNGVSTLDLVLIQKHILGLSKFESPYQVFAADINNDKNISAIDLVELRKLILGIYRELPNNESWRFADAEPTFDDPLNPFPFAERINIVFLSENMIEDFVGVKVGDVSGNAIANSLQVSSRSNEMLTFRVDDQNIDAGELVRVAISSAEFTDVTAFQFTMNLAGLEFAGIESGAIAMTEENIAVHKGALTFAWTHVNGITEANDVLFTLTFKALAGINLRDAISLGSNITYASVYKTNEERFGADFTFDTGEGLVGQFELYQNEPNPFSAVTTISFQLAQEGPAELTVFDVTGKTVTVIRGQYARGYNEVSINKTDLGASGVLYYQLESGDFTATRKMVVID